MTRPALVVVCLGASGGNEPRFDTDPVALPWHYQQHAEVTDHDRMHSRLVSETARVLDCTKTDAKTVLIVGKGGSRAAAQRMANAVRGYVDKWPEAFVCIVGKSAGAIAAIDGLWLLDESTGGEYPVDLLVTIDPATEEIAADRASFRGWLMTPPCVKTHWNAVQRNTQPSGLATEWQGSNSNGQKIRTEFLADPDHKSIDEWVCAKPVFDGLTLAGLIEKEWKG